MEEKNPVKSFEPAKGVNPDKFFDRIKAKHVIALMGAVALLIVSMGISSVSYKLHKESTEALDNHARVEELSKLTYYLTLKEDGVDVSGTESSDSATANISGGITTVTDRLPDGLKFVGFETTSDGTIGAAQRGNTSIACSGHVIDDTKEETIDSGTWNEDKTEFYYHGLHYDAESRIVSFKTENVQAGCGLTVGIITKTPTLGNVSRKDFYNTAHLNEGILNLNSNTMHVWMGDAGVTTYDVNYSYTGDVPVNAPTAPESQAYTEGSTVQVEASPIVEGYQFSGWTTDDAAVSQGNFEMPSSEVSFVGSFVAKPDETTYSVTYVIDGKAPKGYVVPNGNSYAPGSFVESDLTSNGSVIDDFTFNGWTSEDVDVSERGFTMPAHDVTIHGSFTQKTYTVSYQFEGDILPDNANDLLPETKAYPAGAKVTREADPAADGYRFVGWYKNETFTMPAENVTIYGEWAIQNGTFAPEISMEILNKQEQYQLGDTVEFEIKVKNTAEYAITDVQLIEQLEGAEFVVGDAYELKTQQYVLIPEILSSETISVYAKFVVPENADRSYDNKIELVGAIADGGYYLDLDQDYFAQTTFLSRLFVAPEETDDGSAEDSNVGDDTETGTGEDDWFGEKYTGLANTLDNVKIWLFAILVFASGIIAYFRMTGGRNLTKMKKHDIGIKKTIQKSKMFFLKIKTSRVALLGLAITDAVLLAVIGVLIAGIMSHENADSSTISFMSGNSNYDDGEGGAWKVTKTAKWIGDGEAQLTIDVDTITSAKNANNADVLFLVDVSSSMRGERIEKVKDDMSELTEDLLSGTDNRVAIISFNNKSTGDYLDFTNNKQDVFGAIESLDASGSTSYYQAFKKAGEVLKSYERTDDKELYLLFLTDGYPNCDMPNEQIEYDYLKSEYPFLTVNAIQYEMGSTVSESVKRVSDQQFIASMDTLNNALFDAVAIPRIYEEFTITDSIADPFIVSDVDSMDNELGGVDIVENETGNSTIIWSLGGLLRSGESASLSLTIRLKDDYLRTGGEYETNQGETVVSQLEDDTEESVSSEKTPILKNNYLVYYVNNIPDDCEGVANNITEEHFVYQAVDKNQQTPVCQGYNFAGYQFATDDIVAMNGDYFRMPEKDVVLNGGWEKVSLEKTMDGTVYNEAEATLDTGVAVGIKMKKLSGQSTVYEDSGNSTITAFKRSNDLPSSLDLDSEAHIISSDDSQVPVYAWFDEGVIYYYSVANRIYLNSNSYGMFYWMTQLSDISGLEDVRASKAESLYRMFTGTKIANLEPIADWDISNVNNMSATFSCVNTITNIDALANWDTGNVEHMYSTFGCVGGDSKLSNIDGAKNWNVSKVKEMERLFYCAYSLTNIDALANWDVSNVESMWQMFWEASSLTNIDGALNWNTPKLSDVQSMFYGASALENIDGAKNWDMSHVTSFSTMFRGASSLQNIDGALNWDTSNVTSMYQMFYGAAKLANIDGAINWDTSNVKSMYQMFYTYDPNSLANIDGALNWDTSSVTNMAGMFQGAGSLENIDGAVNWNTSSVTTMEDMFRINVYSHKSSLENINGAINWDTSKVTSMKGMFTNERSLVNIDGAKNWDISSVTTTASMFSNASATNLGALKDWDTSNITSMNAMFSNMKKLADINGLSAWDVSKVEDMKYTFGGVESLESIDALSAWNVQKVKDMTQMFYGDSKLKNIDGALNWNTSSATTMSSMFSECSTLANIDGAINWDTSSVTAMSYMFKWNYNLSDISGARNWDTSKVTTTASMFESDRSILDLSPLENWNTRSLKTKTKMFNGVPSSVTRPTWY